MTKRYHGNTKIFFKDPYVLRVSYPKDITEQEAKKRYRQLTRNAYKLIKFTWGHSALEYEMVRIKNDFNHQIPPGPGHYAGLSPGLVIASLMDPDYSHEFRGYFCFADETDALQFKLSIDTNAVHVHMWPSERLFIIHEYIETDES